MTGELERKVRFDRGAEVRRTAGVVIPAARRHLLARHDTGLISIAPSYLRIAHCSVDAGALPELVRRLDDMGYRGDYSFEVFNDDYTQLSAPLVAARARASVKWLTDHVSRRSLPVRRVV